MLNAANGQQVLQVKLLIFCHAYQWLFLSVRLILLCINISVYKK